VSEPAYVPQHILYHKRLAGGSLLVALQQARMVVCRSGYSTLMDLVALRKKAIVIPTPGQTEQEYLGKYLHRKGFFYCAAQKHFNLFTALQDAQQFPWCKPTIEDFGVYKQVLDEWIGRMSG
jgi:predicted glycosyltransferase